MSKDYHIAIGPGDGIGREIIGWAQKALETVSAIEGGFSLQFTPIEVGLGAYKKTGEALSSATLDTIRQADATLLVAISAAELPKSVPNPISQMRRGLDMYANIRPVKDYPGFAPAGRNSDLIVVRENTEGFFSGIEYRVGVDAACAVRLITRKGSERIARVAFKLAKNRRKKLTVVHKIPAHPISDGLFVEIVEQIGKEEFPDVEVERMLIDASTVHLIRDPGHFDVILATNAYGDILSDAAAEITGGVGLAPSGNIGDEAAVFEPSHGSAPDIAGRGIANPIATLLSARFMLEYLEEHAAGNRIQRAVERVIENATVLTPDMGGTATTDQVAEAIIQELGA